MPLLQVLESVRFLAVKPLLTANKLAQTHF